MADFIFCTLGTNGLIAKSPDGKRTMRDMVLLSRRTKRLTGDFGRCWTQQYPVRAVPKWLASRHVSCGLCVCCVCVPLCAVDVPRIVRPSSVSIAQSICGVWHTMSTVPYLARRQYFLRFSHKGSKKSLFLPSGRPSVIFFPDPCRVACRRHD